LKKAQRLEERRVLPESSIERLEDFDLQSPAAVSVALLLPGHVEAAIAAAVEIRRWVDGRLQAHQAHQSRNCNQHVRPRPARTNHRGAGDDPGCTRSHKVHKVPQLLAWAPGGVSMTPGAAGHAAGRHPGGEQRTAQHVLLWATGA